MGVIPNEIPQQAFELIRDRIAVLLADELYQQSAINYTDDLDAVIFLERFVPINGSECSHGAIIISYDGTNYSSESQPSADGTCNFSIDCYFSAKSSTTGDGNKRAKLKLHRLIGVIRGILMDSRYNTLGFARPFIMNRRVADIKIADPINSQDAASVIMGRLVFSVRVAENVALSSVRVLDEYVTQAIIGVSDQGYLYSGTSAPPVDPICAGVSVLINGVSEYDVTSGGTLSLTIIDTDGVEQGVVSGTTITVPAASGGGAIDIDVNGAPFYVGVSTNQDLPVINLDANPVGYKVGPNFVIGNTTAHIKNTLGDELITAVLDAETSGDFVVGGVIGTINGAAFTESPAETEKTITVKNSATTNVGTKVTDTALALAITIADTSAVIKNTAAEILLTANLAAETTSDFQVGDSPLTVNGSAISDLPAEQSKAITIRYANNDPVVVTTVTDTATVFVGEVPNLSLTYDFYIDGVDTGQDVVVDGTDIDILW